MAKVAVTYRDTRIYTFIVEVDDSVDPDDFWEEALQISSDHFADIDREAHQPDGRVKYDGEGEIDYTIVTDDQLVREPIIRIVNDVPQYIKRG